MNLVEPILYHCKLNPWDVAICVPSSPLESISYGRLEALIHNIARAALSSGLRPRDVVAVSLGDVIVHAALSLALMRCGITTLPLRDGDGLKGLVIDAIVTDAPQRFGQAKRVIGIDSSWLNGDGRGPDYDRLYRSTDEDIGRIVLTSAAGGSSAPVGVALSHRLLWDGAAACAFQNGSDFSRISRLYCNLDIATAAGFRYVTYTLLRGGTVFFLGDDPATILQYGDLHRIESMASGQVGLETILRYLEMDSAFACRFDHIVCQGCALPRELSERVRARMCQTLFCAYDTAETGTIAFGPASVLADFPGAVGYVGPGITIEAVDPRGQSLPTGQIGTIRVRSPFAAAGYVGDHQAAPRDFRDGWFYIGDSGFITSDRLLVLSERKSDDHSAPAPTPAYPISPP